MMTSQVKSKTHREKSKQALTVHRHDFKMVAENLPDIICRFDSQFNHLYVNPAITQVTGVPQEMFIGRTPHQVMPPPFADFWVKHIDVVFKTKERLTMEFIFPLPTGDRHYQSFLVTEIAADGEVISVLTISRDITTLKEEEKRKDEFFGIMSHELKTPITSIKAFTQILHKRLLLKGDTEHAKYLEKMDTQINKLTTLISDLLDVTKIVGGKLTFHKEIFDFNEVVREIVDYIQPISAKHKIVIQGKSEGLILGDRERTGQVLMNFLSNAIKYSRDKTKVLVHVASTTTEITCCVQDFGIGIREDQLDSIFDRFYRVRGEGTNGSAGLGLGLYIASQIVQQQGGKIWVESTPGKGSKFCFTLPLK